MRQGRPAPRAIRLTWFPAESSADRAVVPSRWAMLATFDAVGATADVGASGYRCCVSIAMREPIAVATLCVQVPMEPAAALAVSTALGTFACSAAAWARHSAR